MKATLYSLLTTTIIIIIGANVSAKKFLFTAFNDKGSHISSMTPVIEALAKNGHNVTIIYTFRPTLPTASHPNVNFIHAYFVHEVMPKKDIHDIFWRKASTPLLLPLIFWAGSEAMGRMLEEKSEQVSGCFIIQNPSISKIRNSKYEDSEFKDFEDSESIKSERQKEIH